MADAEAAERILASWTHDTDVIEAYLAHLRGTTSRKGGGGLRTGTILTYVRLLSKVHRLLGPLETWTPARLDAL
ncbi:MAG: hypothetical protein V3U52_04080 [Thermoplasmata archaeon]